MTARGAAVFAIRIERREEGGEGRKDVVKGAQTKLGATKGVTKCPKVNSPCTAGLAMLLKVCILECLSVSRKEER